MYVRTYLIACYLITCLLDWEPHVQTLNLHNLTAPDLPATKTYDQLVTILQNHLSPKPIAIAERFRFHMREQRTGESVCD